MKISETGRLRKGFILIHAMTLCSDQEMFSGIAATLSHHA
jgi:hypothetical protein